VPESVALGALPTQVNKLRLDIGIINGWLKSLDRELDATANEVKAGPHCPETPHVEKNAPVPNVNSDYPDLPAFLDRRVKAPRDANNADWRM
jgi:hypothetical protein